MNVLLVALVAATSNAEATSYQALMFEPIEMSTGHVATVKRMIRIQPADAGRFDVIGAWELASAGAPRGGCHDGAAFDASILDPETSIPQPPDPNCELFHWLGASFRNVRHANDFVVEPGFAGAAARQAGFIWHNGTENEPQFVALLVFENGDPNNCGVDTDGNGTPDTPMSGFLAGFVFDFGPRPYGAQYTCVSLCHDPQGFRLPADGAGMYEMVLARAFEDTDGDGQPDTLIPATLAQPLLYYNEQDADGDGVNEWDLAGTQTFIQFDDVSPYNGVYDLQDSDGNGVPDECHTYDLTGMGVCPRYLSSAVTFWASLDGGDPCPGDVNGNGAVDLGDLSTLLASFGACIGQPGYNADADLSPNSCVDLADLTILLGNFGNICP